MAQFGGSWTEQKLDIVESYLKAYLLVMKKQRFSLGYIDAFAGEGSIELASTDAQSVREVSGLVEGSVRRALSLDPGFDGYVLIERDGAAVAKLNLLREEYPNRRIDVIQGDANEKLGALCQSADWSGRRAVAFLDPAGMQVEWATMQAIADTGAIDAWIWFPLGVGVNRLLTRSGKIPPAWQHRLDKIFGTDEWRAHFYRQTKEQTLFGPHERTEKTAKPVKIAEFYNERLKSIFPAVAPNPRIMYNSTRNPIYLLCFASANPGIGGNHAIRIAKHLLGKA